MMGGWNWARKKTCNVKSLVTEEPWPCIPKALQKQLLVLCCGVGVDWQVPVWDVGQSERGSGGLVNTTVGVSDRGKGGGTAKTEKVFWDLITYGEKEERK